MRWTSFGILLTHLHCQKSTHNRVRSLPLLVPRICTRQDWLNVALFSASTKFEFPVETLFGYHASAGAIDRLIPPWEPASVASGSDSLAVGSIVEVDNWLGPIRQRWVAEHIALEPNRLFIDQLNSSPFAKWVHAHKFTAVSEGRSELTDSVEYRLPLDPISRIALPWVHRKLEGMFRFRHRITRDDLAFAQQLFGTSGDAIYSLALRDRPKRIGISGASGLIGRRTVALARVLGIEIVRLERTDPKKKSEGASARWPRGVQSISLTDWTSNPKSAEWLNGLDAWIHLGGVGIADRRWSDSTKRAIRESRTRSTDQIVGLLHQLEFPPKCLVCASGVGAFGNRGDEILSEKSSIERAVTGEDFLADVAREWERSAFTYETPSESLHRSAQQPLRAAIARFGMVLHPRAGALSKLLLPFRLGLGGPIGNGRQYWPWIHIDDAASVLLHLALRPDCHGIYHATAPETLTNRDFSKTLGRVLLRPAILPAPSFAMRLLLGEMADSLLLSSVRVTTDRLLQSGYQFRFPQLGVALANLLGTE